MDYYDIHRPNRNLPASPRPGAHRDPPEVVPKGGARLSIEETSNFLEAYNNPAFGWFAASRLHDAGVEKLRLVDGNDLRHRVETQENLRRRVDRNRLERRTVLAGDIP